MPGDGVSLPTTLAQLGNVAKAQVRASSPPQPSTPFADLAEQKGVLKAQRVQEPGQVAAERRVDPDRDGLDKRQRRRLRRQGKNAEPGPDAQDGPAEGDADNASPLGHLVDLRA